MPCHLLRRGALTAPGGHTGAPPPQGPGVESCTLPQGFTSFKEYIGGVLMSVRFGRCMLPALELPRPFVLMVCLVDSS